MTAVVYFLRAPSNGRIKIGYSTDLPGRVAALSTSAGEPLDLIGAMKAGREEERAIHDAFAHDRIIGEWFQPSDALLEKIEAFRQHFIDTTKLAGRRETELRRVAARPDDENQAAARMTALLRETAEGPSNVWLSALIEADARTTRNWLEGKMPRGGQFVMLCRALGPAFANFVIFGPDIQDNGEPDNFALQIAALRVRADILERRIQGNQSPASRRAS